MSRLNKYRIYEIEQRSVSNELCMVAKAAGNTKLLGDNSKMEPPDPIPSSEVKRLSADGSVGGPMRE